MSTLGEFFTGMVQRSHQGTADRAALDTLAQFSDDQDSAATEKFAQRGKQATALRNVIKSYSDNPDLGHALNSLGVDQLEGIMHGMALNQAQQQVDSQNAERAAQIAWLNQRTKESADEGDATSDLMRRFAELRTGGVGAPSGPMMPPMSQGGGLAGLLNQYSGGAPTGAPAAAGAQLSPSDAMVQAFGDVGRMNPRAGAALMKTFAPFIMGNSSEDLTPGTYVDKETGAHFVYRGKQLLPAGYAPDKIGAGKPVPITDPDGNLMGFSFTDVHGHVTHLPYKGSATVKQVRDESGNPVDGFFMDSQGHALNTQSAMEKAGYEVTTDADGNPKIALKATAPEYKTKNDVVADFKAGKITREKAAKILNEQFKVPLK